MTSEEIDEFQKHWLKLKKILREIEFIRLGKYDDELYTKTLKCVVDNLKLSLEELKMRIEK